jgi:hypothetical protein
MRASMIAGGLLLSAVPLAHAHGIQGRAELPVPIRAFYWAAAIVLVVSFIGLSLGWRRPLLAGLLESNARAIMPGPTSRLLLAAARVASVLLLALVLATALFGSHVLNSNFAPIWVFVVWWIGIAVLAATVGDWWRAVHPVAVIARRLEIPEHVDRPLPAFFGVWPGFVGMLVFTWLELVYPTAANVRLLGVLVFCWIAVTLLAMRRYGIVDTLDRIEPFAVYTRVLGGLGIVGRRSDGALELRPPVLGVLRVGAVPGLAAFMGLLIGSVSFDGFSRTDWWRERAAAAAPRLVDAGLSARDAQILLGTLGLVAMVTFAITAFLLCSRLSAVVGRLPSATRFGSIATAFAPSLVPIAFAYVVAHYFSFFWFQSQQVIRLASDPFGRGWDLFASASFTVDYSTLSAEAIWIIQVVAIIVGHVLALVLAHDRALEIQQDAPGARGIRSQWPMLVLMVLYTIGGLYFLSDGLNA